MITDSDPGNVPLSAGLGPAVPERVMVYLHAYGDSRADDDGLSWMRISEAVLALRRWSAEVQAIEREQWQLHLSAARKLAEANNKRGDDCGMLARTLLGALKVMAPNVEVTGLGREEQR